MSCNPFSLSVPDGWFTTATEEIKTAGGSLQGDAGAGEFSVPVPLLGIVAGQYSGAATDLLITITQKPFVLPCVSIEAFVRNRLAVRES
jgi:hypothetical protein